MNANECNRINEIIKEWTEVTEFYKRNPESLKSWDTYPKGIKDVLRDLKELVKEPKPTERLTHCPSCDSKDNQEHYNSIDRTICNQCSCVYDSYSGEVYF